MAEYRKRKALASKSQRDGTPKPEGSGARDIPPLQSTAPTYYGLMSTFPRTAIGLDSWAGHQLIHERHKGEYDHIRYPDVLNLHTGSADAGRLSETRAYRSALFHGTSEEATYTCFRNDFYGTEDATSKDDIVSSSGHPGESNTLSTCGMVTTATYPI